MYDVALTRQYARFIERVLVVDPHPAASRLLADLLKDMGANRIFEATSADTAISLAHLHEPMLVLTECAGPGFDGLQFVRSLRRSGCAARKAPVIMITAEATAQTIIGARNSGVHEFLRRPFTLKDFARRIEVVTGKPRNWVEAVHYVGPDRRRFNSGEYKGPRKRKSDASGPPPAEQALRILKSAIGAIESDPAQALRSMQAQAVELARAGAADPSLATHAVGLQNMLQQAVAAGRLDRAAVEAAAAPLLARLPAEAVG